VRRIVEASRAIDETEREISRRYAERYPLRAWSADADAHARFAPSDIAPAFQARKPVGPEEDLGGGGGAAVAAAAAAAAIAAAKHGFPPRDYFHFTCAEGGAADTCAGAGAVSAPAGCTGAGAGAAAGQRRPHSSAARSTVRCRGRVAVPSAAGRETPGAAVGRARAGPGPRGAVADEEERGPAVRRRRLIGVAAAAAAGPR
jgi:hypothetical protein